MFEIHADIKKARTLPSEFYTDERYFELSKEKIFARTWQFVGRAVDVAGLQPVTLLPGVLDEPVLIVKTDNFIDCLSNVCTHRGKILVEEPCEAPRLIRCGYHGRRFSLDGSFLSMPEFEAVEDFPSEVDNLLQVPIAVRRGFMFASVDPIAPFDEFVNDVAERFSDDNYDGPLRLTATREYEIDAHWALYCENYLEGFHIPYVHHSLNEVVDYGTYATETFRYCSLQTARSEPPASAEGQNVEQSRNNWPPAHAGGSDIAARYLFIFPNMMFNFYPWGISVNVVRPISPSKTVIEFLTYIADEPLVDKGAGADLHGVELEDEAVVESVQRGIRSRFYSHGRYSPTREQGTHHFHRLIAEFMNAN